MQRTRVYRTRDLPPRLTGTSLEVEQGLGPSAAPILRSLDRARRALRRETGSSAGASSGTKRSLGAPEEGEGGKRHRRRRQPTPEPTSAHTRFGASVRVA